MLKLMRLLVCTALVSLVLLCADQGSPSGHFFALEHIRRTLMVANESSAHITGQCWNGTDGLLNRSAIMLLFLLIMPRHNSSGAFVQHIVDCGHPARKWVVVVAVIVVVQRTLSGWDPTSRFDMKNILQLSLAWGQSTSAPNKGTSEAESTARSPPLRPGPAAPRPRAARTCLLAAPEGPGLGLGQRVSFAVGLLHLKNRGNTSGHESFLLCWVIALQRLRTTFFSLQRKCVRWQCKAPLQLFLWSETNLWGAGYCDLPEKKRALCFTVLWIAFFCSECMCWFYTCGPDSSPRSPALALLR